MLFLSGPFQTMAEVVAELTEEITTGTINYSNPKEALTPFLAAMAPYERLKNPQPPARIILSATGKGVDPLTAISSWVDQNVLQQELETINSLLCGPCHCRLCCIGPQNDMRQLFFEIPLNPAEITFFSTEQTDNETSRHCTSNTEPPFKINHKPFYHCQTPQLIHWQQGWGLILPPETSCPNLDNSNGGCTIYPQRPEVCRRPQIFAYALEPFPSHDSEYEGQKLTAYRQRNTLLAIWDCPYVQQFQDEISNYGQLCELEVIFKKNKE